MDLITIMIYTEEDLPQKSDKWKEFRSDKLGTSEISIIRGKFPKIWCDDYQLFLRKMGKPHTYSNEYTEVGDKDEEYARNFVINYFNNCVHGKDESVFCRNVYDRTGYNSITESNFERYTVQYKHFPQIFSSFDGIDLKNKIVLEIKCPSDKTFIKLLKNRKPTIPKMYFDQIQGQLLTANSHWGITNGIFAVFYKDGIYFEDKKTRITNLIRLILIKTELDLEYCKEMEDVCKKYVKMIETRRWKEDWND